MRHKKKTVDAPAIIVSGKKDVFEDNWSVRLWKQEGLLEALPSLVQVYRQAFLTVIQTRFPDLLEWAKLFIADITHPAAIEACFMETSIAPDSQFAEHILTAFHTYWKEKTSSTEKLPPV